MFFYGFILVQFGAIDFIIKGIMPGAHLPFGVLYPGFTFFQEMVTLLILVAVFLAFYRRYIEKLVRLKRNFKSGLVLIFIGGLMFTVLLGNGMNMIGHSHEATWTEPVASFISIAFAWIGERAAIVTFYVSWWAHLLILLTFLVLRTAIQTCSFNRWTNKCLLASVGKEGKLKGLDFEDESQETFGVGKIEDFTQHQLIDLYACVECGRCSSMCPATGTGKILSPMDLIIKLRDHLTNHGAAVTSKQPWVPTFAFTHTIGNRLALASARQELNEVEAGISYNPQLIGDVITEEEIWACTTCRNCEDQCPVMNEHVDKIIDLRRYLVLTEGKVDAGAQHAMTRIERQGNPWGMAARKKKIGAS